MASGISDGKRSEKITCSIPHLLQDEGTFNSVNDTDSIHGMVDKCDSDATSRLSDGSLNAVRTEPCQWNRSFPTAGNSDIELNKVYDCDLESNRIPQGPLCNGSNGEGQQAIVSIYREGEMCSICLETFAVGDSIAKAKKATSEDDSIAANELVPTFGCTHLFHTNCIVEWLIHHDKCPCCRADFFRDSDDEHERTVVLMRELTIPS